MRVLFYIVLSILLAACAAPKHKQPVQESNVSRTVKPVVIKEECNHFPYDHSDSPCNIKGWMEYAYQSLMHSEEEHQRAFAFKANEDGVQYKRLILLTSHYETDKTRQQALQLMQEFASRYANSFGHFLQIQAAYTEQDLAKKKEAIKLQAELKKSAKKNRELQKSLSDAQSKIQALLDIEKDLKPIQAK